MKNDTVEDGEILIGSGDGACALIYMGNGETSDRVINFAGKKSTVTFDQSGSGLLKLTSAFVNSGYGHDKTVVLTGSTAGSGEIANPYDRAGKAVTSVTKSGTGTWKLSGTNTCTGPITVNGGTLSLTPRAQPRRRHRGCHRQRRDAGVEIRGTDESAKSHPRRKSSAAREVFRSEHPQLDQGLRFSRCRSS